VSYRATELSNYSRRRCKIEVFNFGRNAGAEKWLKSFLQVLWIIGGFGFRKAKSIAIKRKN
jgi:hypothetical protein